MHIHIKRTTATPLTLQIHEWHFVSGPSVTYVLVRAGAWV